MLIHQQRFMQRILQINNTNQQQAIILIIYCLGQSGIMKQEEERVGIPQKKIKRDEQFESSKEKEQSKIFCKCYSQKQIQSILSAIMTIQNYTKYISIKIRHQQKSIAILPKQILSMEQFSQLGQRINKCIETARFNNEFLSKVTKSYSQHLHQAMKSQNIVNNQSQIAPNSILNIFIHIVKQWSELSQSTKQPMRKVIQLINKHATYQDKPRILLEGSGMGRLVLQIIQNLKAKPQMIQACQDRVLHYLFGQYFIAQLKKNSKPQKIYPFIHDFSNRYNTKDAYQQFRVPQFNYLQPISNPLSAMLQNVYTNLGSLQQEYSSNSYNNQWDILVSYLCNDRVQNILKWIQIVYKGLKTKGIWIIVSYSSFQRNIIPITLQQFVQILNKTQFKLIQKLQASQQIISDRSMTKQRVKMHYFVLEK